MDIKERIINEATRLFYESGIKTVRMDDIAAACGISKRTLYEHFADREELIRQSLIHYFTLWQHTMRDRTNSAENIIEEFWMTFGHGAKQRDFIMRVMKDLIKFYPKIFKDFLCMHHSNVEEINKRRLEKGMEEGLFLKNIDTDFLAKNLTSYLYGLKKDFDDYNFSADINNKRSADSFQLAIMLFLRGLTTEKGREYIDRNIIISDSNGKLSVKPCEDQINSEIK